MQRLYGAVWDVTALETATRALVAQKASLLEAQARYETLVNGSPDGVFVHVGGVIRFVNPAGANLVGASTPDALVGTHVFGLLVPKKLANDRAADGEPFGVMERQLVRLDTGERVHVEVSAVPTQLVEQGVSVDAVQVIVRDITARRRTEAARHALEARLQQAQKLEAVGQLAGGMAHDLNNLLLVVSGSRELASNSLDEQHPALLHLREIGDAAARAHRLVRSLLVFSRGEAVRYERLDFAEVVRGFLPLLRTAVGELVDLRFRSSGGAFPLEADPAHLEQILLNLVVNAKDAVLSARHGRDGKGGRVSIHLRRRHIDAEIANGRLAPGAYAELTVRDNGHGIDQDTLGRVFEPFFTTKDVGEGTGLGLATVFGITQRLAGDVRISSRVGLAVPAPKVPQVRTAPHQALVGVTALVVDDQDDVRRIAKRLLERAGAAVLMASGAHDARRVWAEHQEAITCLVTDVRMPRESGFELAATLRDERPDLPVVFMSGFAEDEADQNVGAHSLFLPKPFSISELEAAIVAVASIPTERARGDGIHGRGAAQLTTRCCQFLAIRTRRP